MDYEKKYEEALKRAKKLYEQGTITESLSYVFPELAESEDGENKRISKEITQFLKQNNGWNREWLTWLEKQTNQSEEDETIELLAKDM